LSNDQQVTSTPAHIAIVAGGTISEKIADQIRTMDYIIGADRGALYLVQHNIIPDQALGDFDSVTEDEREHIRASSRKYMDCDAVDKNYTDTELAFNHALAMKPTQITLFGVTGTRLDHTLSNIHLLRKAVDEGIKCQIVDEHNIIMLTNSSVTLQTNSFPYVSLLPLSSTVTGITLTGFKYPLHDATLQIGQSLGISNEWDDGNTASVRVREGYLLIICSRD